MKQSTQWSDHFKFMPNLKIMARRLTPKERESRAIQDAVISATKSADAVK